MSSVPLSLFFFIIGVLFRDKILIVNNVKHRVVVAAGFFIISFVLSQVFSPLNMMNGHLGTGGLLSIILSFVGIMSTWSLSEFLSGRNMIKRFMQYVGKNTLPILGLSQLYYLFAKDLLTILNVPLYASFTLRIILMCLALWVSIIFINKNIPLLVGKQKG